MHQRVRRGGLLTFPLQPCRPPRAAVHCWAAVGCGVGAHATCSPRLGSPQETAAACVQHAVGQAVVLSLLRSGDCRTGEPAALQSARRLCCQPPEFPRALFPERAVRSRLGGCAGTPRWPRAGRACACCHILPVDRPATHRRAWPRPQDITTLFHLNRDFKYISKWEVFMVPVIGWSMFLTGGHWDARGCVRCLAGDWV